VAVPPAVAVSVTGVSFVGAAGLAASVTVFIVAGTEFAVTLTDPSAASSTNTRGENVPLG
jgi:hypothetical protein